jgi:hypothetical protein
MGASGYTRVDDIMCCMVAGALGVILMDNEPNTFRTVSKNTANANLTVISILEVRVPRRLGHARCNVQRSIVHAVAEHVADCHACILLAFMLTSTGIVVDAPLVLCRLILLPHAHEKQ